RAVEVARAKEIPYQIEAIPAASGTNAWAIQIVEDGVSTLVISLPLRYMHSPVEMLTLSDVYNVGKLLCEFIKSFDGQL
ncbi:MAG: M42 family peptidase, partial [Clostridia bacterium]|nr:M42 family peptidase [Clostridia bacterium]